MAVKERHSISKLADVAAQSASEPVDCIAADSVVFMFTIGLASEETIIEFSDDPTVGNWYEVEDTRTTHSGPGNRVSGIAVVARWARIRTNTAGGGLTNLVADAPRIIA